MRANTAMRVLGSMVASFLEKVKRKTRVTNAPIMTGLCGIARKKRKRLHASNAWIGLPSLSLTVRPIGDVMIFCGSMPTADRIVA